jgi:hypothetical protein
LLLPTKEAMEIKEGGEKFLRSKIERKGKRFLVAIGFVEKYSASVGINSRGR